jgi:hypothetical protein
MQGCGAIFVPAGELPSDMSSLLFRPWTTHLDDRRYQEKEIGGGSNSARRRFVRPGNNYHGSICAFAVKPRAFGAPHAALGLDCSAQPSKGAAMPQCNLVT